ncbi:hypothetical protein WMY93_004867 [Mugilogobius chulae]|uniref:VWFA domain-containing protein n=1 Tax=Mugilogobius chulae TaxID=88201 RepID=A0AAW0Q0G9_9GOBI
MDPGGLLLVLFLCCSASFSPSHSGVREREKCHTHRHTCTTHRQSGRLGLVLRTRRTLKQYVWTVHCVLSPVVRVDRSLCLVSCGTCGPLTVSCLCMCGPLTVSCLLWYLVDRSLCLVSCSMCRPLTVSCLWYVWTAHCVLSPVYVWTAHCVLSVYVWIAHCVLSLAYVWIAHCVLSLAVRVDRSLCLVSCNCSLTDKHRADVVLVLDGFNNITSEDFSKVTRFLETLVQNLGVVGLDLVRFALVKCGVKPEIEFYLNTYNDVSSVVSAVKNLSQSPASPGDLTCNIVELRKTILWTNRGGRNDAPEALIVISDRNSPDINKDTVTALWRFTAKVFIVAVKEADYSEMNNIGNNLGKPEVFNVQNFNSFLNVLIELTQCFCRWIKEKLEERNSLICLDIEQLESGYSLKKGRSGEF